jgi:type I restriction enzyme R subunit
VAAACAPFDRPALRDEIESARREREQLIDHINLDQVTFAGFSEQAEAQAQGGRSPDLCRLHRQHKDDIDALNFFYQQPYQRRALTFDMIEDLHEPWPARR